VLCCEVVAVGWDLQPADPSSELCSLVVLLAPAVVGLVTVRHYAHQSC
jgi:hypothetical protein